MKVGNLRDPIGGSFLSIILPCLPEGGITGRGCSTKDKVYYKECETNSYGEGTEKFCYCNFYLCNSAPAVPAPALPPVILPLLVCTWQLLANRYMGTWGIKY